MARNACYIQTSIWQDGPFLALSFDAKGVYLMLLSQPDVAMTGRLPMRIRPWAAKLRITPMKLVELLSELAVGGFIWDDLESEEIIIRSWIKHNAVGHPKYETSARSGMKAIDSWRLRARLATEYPLLFQDVEEAQDAIRMANEWHKDGIDGVEVRREECHPDANPLWSVASSQEQGEQLSDLHSKAVSEAGTEPASANEEIDEPRSRAITLLMGVIGKDADKWTRRTLVKTALRVGSSERDLHRVREAILDGGVGVGNRARYAVGALQEIAKESA